jgi:Trk K+ transport system NAD-binding subunit
MNIVLQKVIVGENFDEITLIDLGSLKKFDIYITASSRDYKFILPKANDKIKPYDILTIFSPKKSHNLILS